MHSKRTQGYIGVEARSSHIYVACRSVCDKDQNEIKRSVFLLGTDQEIRTNPEQLISNDQHILLDTKEVWQHLSFEPSEGNDQVIKDDFTIKILDLANISTGNK